jgi:hypothetical protein
MHETGTHQRALPGWALHAGLLLLSLAFVLVTLHLLTPVYMENDDVAIMDFATQGFSMPYAGVFFTSLLHLAYVRFPETAWYAVALYGLHVLALYVWLTLVSRVFRPLWLAALFALLLLGYYLVFLLYLDYTSTSIMLCTAGLTWTYLDVMERRAGYLRYLLPGLVFMLGMLVRPQGAPGSLAYTLPIGLLAAWISLRGLEPKPELRRLLLIGLLFLAPALAEDGLDHAWRAYSATPQQRQYDAFNDARGKLQRINRGRKQAIMRNTKLLKSVGWTRRDAVFFFNWNFLDERIYTPEALRTVLAAAPPPHPEFSTVLDTVARRFPPDDMLFLMIVAPAPLLLLLARRRRDLAVAGALIPLYAVALTSFMTLFFAFEWRVRLPFETGFACCSLLVAGWIVTRHAVLPPGGMKAALALCVTLLGIGLYAGLHQQWVNYPGMRTASMKAQRTIDILNRDFAGKVLLLEPKVGLPLERLDPLQVVHLQFQPVQLGWSTFSPRFYAQIAPLGIDHGYQLVDALITGKDGYALGTGGWCKILLPYATVPGADQVQPVVVERITRGVAVYRLMAPAQAQKK